MNFLKSFTELQNHFFKKENIINFIIILIIFFLDRISKFEITNNYDESVIFINNYINFDLVWNIGIGFGLLSVDSSVLYNLMTLVIGSVIIILIYLSLISEKIDKLIYSTIIGGALGNFYDRLVYKAVPDFIDIHYLNFHWFTFNVADIFISIGIIIFIMRSFTIKN